jgi:hypothetical protein
MKEFAGVEMRRREIDEHKQAQKKRERSQVRSEWQLQLQLKFQLQLQLKFPAESARRCSQHAVAAVAGASKAAVVCAL